MLKKQYFTLLFIFNFIYSNEGSLDLINLIEKDRVYFSINISPDGSSATITNSNYSQLHIVIRNILKMWIWMISMLLNVSGLPTVKN